MYSTKDDPPPVGRAFMAYKSSIGGAKPLRDGGRVWEDVRKEARKLEGELDVKLASYAKLCSGFEATYRHRANDGVDQLSQSKAAELEDLLQRLSDLNDEMGGLTGGREDARSHTLARHRDILQEFTQEFRRLNSTLGAARDRVQLLGSESPHIGLTVTTSGTQGLLRERANIGSNMSAIDDVISQAQTVSSSLLDQRKLFDGVSDKLVQLGSRFPVVNSLLNAIRRKKSKDALVLGGVITACVLFTILYLCFK